MKPNRIQSTVQMVKSNAKKLAGALKTANPYSLNQFKSKLGPRKKK